MFFAFPEDARWNPDLDAVEFSVILEPYEGTVRIARRVFQRLLDQSPTPERCMEAFHLQRTRFELIVERKLRRRQLTDDGNVEITGRDLREKDPPAGRRNLFEARSGRNSGPSLSAAWPAASRYAQKDRRLVGPRYS
jgi:uncharacterized protein DUF1488